MNKFSKYVGLDTHKETIAVAIADAQGGKPRYYGEIVNTSEAIRKLIEKLCNNGERLSFCYEARPSKVVEVRNGDFHRLDHEIPGEHAHRAF